MSIRWDRARGSSFTARRIIGKAEMDTLKSGPYPRLRPLQVGDRMRIRTLSQNVTDWLTVQRIEGKVAVMVSRTGEVWWFDAVGLPGSIVEWRPNDA